VGAGLLLRVYFNRQACGKIEGFHNQADSGLITASDMLSSHILSALLVARDNS
jgi:hypothetical protein